MEAKIFLTGFMGSGKTYWGKKWAEQNHLIFFDLDEEVEKVAGDIVANIFENSGEEYFRQMEKNVLRSFADKSDFILACGGGTPCFFENLHWMNTQGITIYLQASADYIFERITNETHHRPLLNKIDPSGLLLFIEQKLKEREPFYKQAMYIVEAATLTSTSLTQMLKADDR